jgi:pimeloyl-ACP methyl ester carboxylesterase
LFRFVKATGWQSPGPEKNMTDVRHSIEKIAGCKVSVRRGGAGQPLLYLHGAGGGSRWLPFMEALSQNFEVIVPEHPGFGPSDTPEWLDNVGDLAYFYLDFIEQMGLEQVHLVGTSLGGWIAAELAVRNQSRLRSLTLVAAAGIHVAGVPKGDIFLWSRQELARNLFYNQELAEAMLRLELSPEEMDFQIKNQLTMAKLAWQPRMHNPHLVKWLHRITVPTLIVWGAEDKLIPASYGPAFRDLIPNAKLEVLPHCGHLPEIEKTAEFVSMVTRFLQGAGR